MENSEKSDRLIESAVAILDAAPNRELNIVSLLKSIFYLDLVSLRDRGELLTFNSYIAIENGPVVAQYQKRLIETLGTRNLGVPRSEWDGRRPVALIQQLEKFIFIDTELMASAAQISQYFAKKSSSSASRYSHKNIGWKIAWESYQRSGRPVAIDMNIALQQVIEADPWLSIPLANSEDCLLVNAENWVGEEW